MRHRLTSLALASSLFSLVTGVTAWFWCQLFTSASVGVADRRIMAGTAIAAALLGAVAGLLLAPVRETDDDLGPPRPGAARITYVVLAFGALAGGIGGAQQGWAHVGLGVGCGFFGAIPLVPGAVLAIAMVRRLERARRGSVVARSDIRALVVATAGILGCSSGLAVFDWPAAAAGVAAPPLLSVILLLAAVALIAIGLLADIVALARVDRWAARVEAADINPPPPSALPAGRLDLGVGDEMASTPAIGTAYRGGGRSLACILGDIDEARAVLRQSIRRGVVLIALLEVVGFAHGIARSPDLAARVSAELCEEGRPAACRSAALLTEQAGLPRTEAARLHGRACEDGQEESCLAVFLIKRAEGPPW